MTGLRLTSRYSTPASTPSQSALAAAMFREPLVFHTTGEPLYIAVA